LVALLSRESGQDDGSDDGKRGQQKEHALRGQRDQSAADFTTDEVAERASSVPEAGDDTDEAGRRAAKEECEAEWCDEQFGEDEERQRCCKPRHADAMVHRVVGRRTAKQRAAATSPSATSRLVPMLLLSLGRSASCIGASSRTRIAGKARNHAIGTSNPRTTRSILSLLQSRSAPSACAVQSVNRNIASVSPAMI
jgi:hypothetical protein